jgi:Ser/Thr protein kinase RdoA (MazF antagonist)
MAVYTDVSAEELAGFLAGYDLGDLLAYKGIAEGVENSNYLVHTARGYSPAAISSLPSTSAGWTAANCRSSSA